MWFRSIQYVDLYSDSGDKSTACPSIIATQFFSQPVLETLVESEDMDPPLKLLWCHSRRANTMCGLSYILKTVERCHCCNLSSKHTVSSTPRMSHVLCHLSLQPLLKAITGCIGTILSLLRIIHGLFSKGLKCG